MQLEGVTALVTGGGSGIGAALAKAFLENGAATVVVADVDHRAAETVTGALGDRCHPRRCDVVDRNAVDDLFARAERDFGPIDVCCANAGVAPGLGLDAPEDTWVRTWQVNVMGIVHTADAFLRAAVTRGSGYLLITASAAGLLTALGDAPYTATKHAAVGLAEWLAITYGDAGVKVSCLCPQGVRTPMVLGGLESDALTAQVVAAQGLIEPDECAAAAMQGLRDERFLILPHPEVKEYQTNKTADPDRWLRGMRRTQRRLTDPGG